MAEVVRLGLHVTGAAIWVGSQVFVYFVMVPIFRALKENPPSRFRALQIMTRRFGWLGGGALVAQVVTGVWLIQAKLPDNSHDIRYGWVLDAKLTMVIVVILLTAIHTFLIGPRMMRLYGDGSAPLSPEAETQMKRLRVQSGIMSAATLLLSLVIIFAGVALVTPWAYVRT